MTPGIVESQVMIRPVQQSNVGPQQMCASLASTLSQPQPDGR